jgi:hypothetical protein
MCKPRPGSLLDVVARETIERFTRMEKNRKVRDMQVRYLQGVDAHPCLRARCDLPLDVLGRGAHCDLEGIANTSAEQLFQGSVDSTLDPCLDWVGRFTVALGELVDELLDFA